MLPSYPVTSKNTKYRKFYLFEIGIFKNRVGGDAQCDFFGPDLKYNINRIIIITGNIYSVKIDLKNLIAISGC